MNTTVWLYELKQRGKVWSVTSTVCATGTIEGAISLFANDPSKVQFADSSHFPKRMALLVKHCERQRAKQGKDFVAVTFYPNKPGSYKWYQFVFWNNDNNEGFADRFEYLLRKNAKDVRGAIFMHNLQWINSLIPDTVEKIHAMFDDENQNDQLEIFRGSHLSDDEDEYSELEEDGDDEDDDGDDGDDGDDDDDDDDDHEQVVLEHKSVSRSRSPVRRAGGSKRFGAGRSTIVSHEECEKDNNAALTVAIAAIISIYIIVVYFFPPHTPFENHTQSKFSDNYAMDNSV